MTTSARKESVIDHKQGWVSYSSLFFCIFTFRNESLSEMKILTGTQIREADRYTMQQESIESIDLMERASETIAQWIAQHVEPDVPLCFLIGKGNNGGDGLAVARILSRAGYLCEV